jgi:hypothetical protein
MEAIMRVSLAMLAMLLIAGAALAQGTLKKHRAWSRPAPVPQTQSISNARMRYYGGPKGERGLVLPGGR